MSQEKVNESDRIECVKKDDNNTDGISSSCDNAPEKKLASKERHKEQKREWKRRNQSKESVRRNHTIYMQKRRSDPEFREKENKRRRKSEVEKTKSNQKDDSLGAQDSEIHKTVLAGDIKESSCDDALLEKKLAARERRKEQKREWKRRNQAKESMRRYHMIYMQKRRSDPKFRENENKRQRKSEVEKRRSNQIINDPLRTQDSEIYTTILFGDIKVSFANDE